ncbi:MAG: hypothetical protein ACYC54_00365 [Sedimentisphaerales bacterium]
MSATSRANVNKLDNPARPKANHNTKIELGVHPPKIVHGSEEWHGHFQNIEELEMDGMLLIRRDAEMGRYCGTLGFKIEQPIGNHIKIETLDEKQHICHLSNLEVCVPDSIKFEWIETKKPGKYLLQGTISILRPSQTVHSHQ